MHEIINNLRPSAVGKFESARNHLLPNEDAEFVCQIEKGFLVLTSRRIVILKEEDEPQYRIQRVIPYDCFLGIELEKEDRAKLTGISLDRYGCHEEGSSVLEVKAPQKEKGDDRDEIRKHFQARINRILDAVDEIMGAEGSSSQTPPPRDYSYLNDMPESLTRNAALDLNTILDDWPLPDQLYGKTEKFLGNEPFFLEESLREGTDKENGVLFAAGLNGYIWVKGLKQGRFMSNVLVDMIEWRNIVCFAHQWQNDGAKINAIYSHHEDGKVLSNYYQWSPTANTDTLQYPWLLEPLNGPWILADIMYRFSDTPLPASWCKHYELRAQRYYP
ncbi:MAG: hypothetical protein ACFE7R_07265 [Candidatus Hodarchaeota archaeon]